MIFMLIAAWLWLAGLIVFVLLSTGFITPRRQPQTANRQP